MKILISLLLLSNLVISQKHNESELKCSHAKTGRAMVTKYSAPLASQNDYDVSFYDINLKIDPVEEKVFGKVGVMGTSTIQSLSTIDIDLSYVLNVESVKNEQGDDLGYEHISNLLTVTLNIPLNTDESFKIYIEYNGKPQASGLGSFGFDRYDLQPMIWSLSEPYGARQWWPCKDTPIDKADSIDISLEVPSNLIAASNGLLVNTEENDGWKTYHWQERYPIATYLVSVAIHPYDVHYDWYKYSVADSMRLEYYVFPDNWDNVKYNYGLTKDMLGAMAQRFGEYPFIEEKYGHAEFVWGGGMEHQTLSSMGGHSEGLIAHELGHQWWGDMVTCANFHHIWLNEGFATYSEALWYEIRDNNIQSLHNDMANNRAWYGWREGSIYVEDTTSVSRIFNGSLTYAKASWVVHMLRHIVGDEHFFNGIREYGERYRFKSATTEQFQSVMEEISGMDLDYFFQRWIYGELYPIYEVSYNNSNEVLAVVIEQIQTSDVFPMPIDIKATFTDNSNFTWVVKNTMRNEKIILDIPSGKTIDKIEVDPDEWILRKNIVINRDNNITLDTTNVTSTPTEFKLYPVFPNPFNSEISIKFYMANDDDVEINIYNLSGKLVWTTTDSYFIGSNIVKWNGFSDNGSKIPSGSYIIEAKTNESIKTQKVMHLK